jgi:hypothetical protein
MNPNLIGADLAKRPYPGWDLLPSESGDAVRAFIFLTGRSLASQARRMKHQYGWADGEG